MAEQKTLVTGISDWTLLFETVYALEELGGLTEAQVEHIQDMMEYNPCYNKHIRAMDIFLAENDQEIILEFQAYTVPFSMQFKPSAECLAKIKSLEGIRQ